MKGDVEIASITFQPVGDDIVDAFHEGFKSDLRHILGDKYIDSSKLGDDRVTRECCTNAIRKMS